MNPILQMDLCAEQYSTWHQDFQRELTLLLVSYFTGDTGRQSFAAFELASRAALSSYAKKIQGSVEATDAALSLAGEASSDTKAVVRSGVWNALREVIDAAGLDQRHIVVQAQKVRLQARMESALSTSQRLFDYHAKATLSSLSFVRPDRAGRKWKTSIAVRTSIRYALVRSYVESALMRLVEGGVDVATLVDQSGEETRISITGLTPDLPKYQDIKGKVFHPNSRIIVK